MLFSEMSNKKGVRQMNIFFINMRLLADLNYTHYSNYLPVFICLGAVVGAV
jgi:hypothetical protein